MSSHPTVAPSKVNTQGLCLARPREIESPRDTRANPRRGAVRDAPHLADAVERDIDARIAVTRGGSTA
jgi:hypothetical protein